MGRALIIALTLRKVAACSRWREYTLKAVRSPYLCMAVERERETTQAIGQQHTSPLRWYLSVRKVYGIWFSKFRLLDGGSVPSSN